MGGRRKKWMGEGGRKGVVKLFVLCFSSLCLSSGQSGLPEPVPRLPLPHWLMQHQTLSLLSGSARV